jgi:hypothetical protein
MEVAPYARRIPRNDWAGKLAAIRVGPAVPEPPCVAAVTSLRHHPQWRNGVLAPQEAEMAKAMKTTRTRFDRGFGAL